MDPVRQTMASMFPDKWKTVTLKTNFSVEMDAEDNSVRKRRRKINGPTGRAKVAKQESGESCTPQISDCVATVPKNTIHAGVHAENVEKIKIVAKSTINKYEGLPCDVEKIEKILKNVSDNLQSVVSMTNYNKTLLGVDTQNLIYTNEVRPVTRKYEEGFLRQAIASDERSCIRGKDCECQFIDSCCPFVGVEFVLPWESDVSKRNGMCLPCLRAATQVFFFDILQSSQKIEGVIQKYYNIHSKPGEYDLGACLVCPPNGPMQNLPMPIVRHQRNFYRVYKKNGGICYMEQKGVAYMEQPFR